MKKLLTVFFTLVIGTWLLVLPVKADCVGQYGQYGQPCESYSIVVDKMVARAVVTKGGQVICDETLDYKDNFSVSDPRFKPSDYLCFQVKIKNTSTTTFGGMTAKDFVPDYLTPIEGPGTFDSTTRTISWDAGAFAVDEQKTYYFKMQVNSQANLPADKGLFCIVNKAEASSNTTYDEDSSQLCIEKQVVPGKVVPSAGPEFGYVLVAGEMALAGLGIYLKTKKVNNYKLN